MSKFTHAQQHFCRIVDYDSNDNLAGGVQVIAVLAGRPSLSNTDILLGVKRDEPASDDPVGRGMPRRSL